MPEASSFRFSMDISRALKNINNEILQIGKVVVFEEIDVKNVIQIIDLVEELLSYQKLLNFVKETEDPNCRSTNIDKEQESSSFKRSWNPLSFDLYFGLSYHFPETN